MEPWQGSERSDPFDPSPIQSAEPEKHLGKEREVLGMPKLPDVPDEVKWQVAARVASAFPVLYDSAFREAVGERFDEIERPVWIYLGQEAAKTIAALGLAAGNSEEIAEALAFVTTIFFGPETKTEKVRINTERSVLLVKRCPFLSRHMESGRDPDHLFDRCMAFSIVATESLNKEYTLRFVRSMCTGDRNCELKIVKKELINKEEAL